MSFLLSIQPYKIHENERSVVKNLYLLDRNIVSDVKNFSAGSENGNTIKARSIDKYGNFISPLLSIIEGNKGVAQTKDEMLACLKGESKAMKKFFKYARTDASFLFQNHEIMVEAFQEDVVKKFNQYSDLVGFLQEKTFKTLNIMDAKNVRGEIFDYACTHSIDVSHPFIMCALACLYGNLDARKVLKPIGPNSKIDREKNRYNALSDLLVVGNVSFIKTFFKENEDIQIHFLTSDKSLDVIFKLFNTEAKNSQTSFDNIITTHNMTIKKSIFTNIQGNDGEMNDLIRDIFLHSSVIKSKVSPKFLSVASYS